MLKDLYARWMYRWETALTTRDENRVVRPLEWGFDWLEHSFTAMGARDFFEETVARATADPELSEACMLALNRVLVARSDDYFNYQRPTDFVLEERAPELFPTNVRPETLAQDARLKQQAVEGKLPHASFLRFTSPERTPYPENDRVNARWYPAPAEKQQGKPKQAIVVMPQWNADAFSHNILCSLFNRFGISALRLSKPYHDIRRPEELERSDYAVSANLGRTISASRQAVVDIRACLDWLEMQGYEQFGVLGTSLGSCYAFIASAHDKRLKVNAFNHAAAAFGDVVWQGQSTRHIRAAFDPYLSQERLRDLWMAISPISYAHKLKEQEKKALVVYADYDLTFPRPYSLEAVELFRQNNVDLTLRVLPCGHYTTGETPYKFIDGWYMGSFVYNAFKKLANEAREQGWPQTTEPTDIASAR